MMTIQEVATYTGFSKAYLYKLTHSRKIPFYKPFGKKLFFRFSEINELFFSERSQTLKEIQNEAAKVIFKNSLKRK